MVISTTIANAQIFTQNAAGGSITITPNGVQGSTNSGTVNTNVALGPDALNKNTTGSENTANGAFALNKNTTGSYNTANGYQDT